MGRAAEATKGVPVIGEWTCRLRNFYLLASCEGWLAQSRQIVNYSAHKVLMLEVAPLIGLDGATHGVLWSGTSTSALMLFDD